MRRPVGSNEIAPLVRLAVWASDWVNHRLYLDGRQLSLAEHPSPLQVLLPALTFEETRPPYEPCILCCTAAKGDRMQRTYLCPLR